jgi:hypothetical protein
MWSQAHMNNILLSLKKHENEEKFTSNSAILFWMAQLRSSILDVSLSKQVFINN